FLCASPLRIMEGMNPPDREAVLLRAVAAFEHPVPDTRGDAEERDCDAVRDLLRRFILQHFTPGYVLGLGTRLFIDFELAEAGGFYIHQMMQKLHSPSLPLQKMDFNSIYMAFLAAAAEGGLREAQYAFGLLAASTPEKGVDWIFKAAEQ